MIFIPFRRFTFTTSTIIAFIVAFSFPEAALLPTN
jgi:hypothetical protein